MHAILSCVISLSFWKSEISENRQLLGPEGARFERF